MQLVGQSLYVTVSVLTESGKNYTKSGEPSCWTTKCTFLGLENVFIIFILVIQEVKWWKHTRKGFRL